jgi:hypothetical protein
MALSHFVECYLYTRFAIRVCGNQGDLDDMPRPKQRGRQSQLITSCLRTREPLQFVNAMFGLAGSARFTINSAAV